MDDAQQVAFEEAWSMLTTGAAQRKSAAHAPVVASIDANGQPTQRVMVLREADPAAAVLRFHSDARAPKMAQVNAGPTPVHVLVYDTVSAVQLRIAGAGHVERDTPRADAAWEAATLFARRCYLAVEPPGSPSALPTSGLPPWAEGTQPSADQIAPARHNFGLLLVTVRTIDWLHLANTGHRRILFSRGEDGVESATWHAQWIAP